MIVHWEMSIGYPTAKRSGEVEIDDEELQGLSEEEQQKVIDEAIWEDAVQYVEVYETEREVNPQ